MHFMSDSFTLQKRDDSPFFFRRTHDTGGIPGRALLIPVRLGKWEAVFPPLTPDWASNYTLGIFCENIETSSRYIATSSRWLISRLLLLYVSSTDTPSSPSPS
ncbi:hypothetical protein TNCV_3632731 [Trichonephila clavipes]|nr:hypothetical protein TNCV_3632731 [Trichonephila clavipes]